MSRAWQWVSASGKFWYGFIIGDDWAAAAGVLVMLGAAYGLLQAHVPAWWVGPVVISITLVVTLRRAALRQTQEAPGEARAGAPGDQNLSAAGRRPADQRP